MYISFTCNSPGLGILNTCKQEILHKLQHVHMVTFCSVMRGKHELLKQKNTAEPPNYVKWAKPERRQRRLCMKFKNRQNYGDGSQVSVAVRRGKSDGKGPEGISRVIGNILCLAWDRGYMVACLCQNA